LRRKGEIGRILEEVKGEIGVSSGRDVSISRHDSAGKTKIFDFGLD